MEESNRMNKSKTPKVNVSVIMDIAVTEYIGPRVTHVNLKKM
jgi:hypothetical protein